jgi:UDP-galactopyranose mutase
MYNYLIVGSGIYGATVARQLKNKGLSVLVIDKRPNIAGNVYTEDIEGIHVHKYGAHIFHTNNKVVWDYVNQFAVFNRFPNSLWRTIMAAVLLPFNMYTFNKMWGIVTPEEVARRLQSREKKCTSRKIQERARNQLSWSRHLQKLIKGYTENRGASL